MNVSWNLKGMVEGNTPVRFLQVVALLAMLTACKPPSADEPLTVASNIDLMAVGEEIYNSSCAQCHYAGEGSDTMPALIGDSNLKGDAAKVIQVILNGQQGVSEINGRKIQGIMPPHDFLSDVEVAGIVSYIRNRFGEGAAPVTPEDVAKLR